jgi:hypothetical protein
MFSKELLHPWQKSSDIRHRRLTIFQSVSDPPPKARLDADWALTVMQGCYHLVFSCNCGEILKVLV